VRVRDDRRVRDAFGMMKKDSNVGLTWEDIRKCVVKLKEENNGVEKGDEGII
jgi:hypothetical protein